MRHVRNSLDIDVGQKYKISGFAVNEGSRLVLSIVEGIRGGQVKNNRY